jgi:hypothetical protein
MSSSNKIVPEIEHLLPTDVHDLGSHTVSVTHIDDLSSIHGMQVSQANVKNWPKLPKCLLHF